MFKFKKQFIITTFAFFWLMSGNVLMAEENPSYNYEDLLRAQLEQKEGGLSTSSNTEVIANINISNAEISEIGKNNFKIIFSAENLMALQSNLVYGLELIKRLDDNEVVFSDSQIFSGDKITLRKDETITKEITYSPPVFLSGDYELWLKIKDESGLTLALKSFDISLNGTNQYIEFSNPCYLTIEGEDEKYSLVQGVDLKEGEKLFFECQTDSKFESEVRAYPQFDFFLRDSFGKKVGSSNQIQDILFTKGDNSLVKINIPLPKEPQAYDVEIYLKNGKSERISNPVIAHFVISGASATIINATLDKDSYQVGDKALLSVILAGSADGFWGSRNQTTNLFETVLTIEVKNDQGELCAEKYLYNWTADKMPQDKIVISLPIQKDCDYPKVFLTLSEQGDVLYEKNLDIQKEGTWKDYLILVVSSLLIIILLGLLFYFWKKGKGINVISIFIFLMVFSFMFFPNGVEASTTTPLKNCMVSSRSGLAAVDGLGGVQTYFLGEGSATPPYVYGNCANYYIPSLGVTGMELVLSAMAVPNLSSYVIVPGDFTWLHNKSGIPGDDVGCYCDIINFTYDQFPASLYKDTPTTVWGTSAGISLCDNGVTAGIGIYPDASIPYPSGWYWMDDWSVLTPTQTYDSGYYTYTPTQTGNYTARTAFGFTHGVCSWENAMINNCLGAVYSTSDVNYTVIMNPVTCTCTADYYRVNNGQTSACVGANVGGVCTNCKIINNNNGCGYDIFVPARTNSPEWSAFIGNHPPCITTTTCI